MQNSIQDKLSLPPGYASSRRLRQKPFLVAVGLRCGGGANAIDSNGHFEGLFTPKLLLFDVTAARDAYTGIRITIQSFSGY